jgi:uncharacterized protein (DUF4415 family)
MAIAKKPISNQLISNSNQITPEQQSFISKASESIPSTETDQERKKVPVMLRIDPDVLERIDRAAKSIGLKRAAFIVSSAVERTNHMEF